MILERAPGNTHTRSLGKSSVTSPTESFTESHLENPDYAQQAERNRFSKYDISEKPGPDRNAKRRISGLDSDGNVRGPLQ